jgi:hypothetical protein
MWWSRVLLSHVLISCFDLIDVVPEAADDREPSDAAAGGESEESPLRRICLFLPG